MKNLMCLFLLLLTGCDSERKILCESPINTSGTMRVVNRQCFEFGGGDQQIALLEVEDTITKKHFTYTMNVVHGSIVLNLSTSQAMQIEAADKAESSANSAMVMSSIAATTASGRR